MRCAQPGRGMTPESVLALQRAAGKRATRQYLQRMVVAIDGDRDGAPAKRLLVPALTALVGEKAWWPSRRRRSSIAKLPTAETEPPLRKAARPSSLSTRSRRSPVARQSDRALCASLDPR
jgi:hypothetical protein